MPKMNRVDALEQKLNKLMEYLTAREAPATSVQPARIATSETKPRGKRAKAPKASGAETGPMLAGLRLVKHPEYEGYARLFFYDAENRPLPRVRKDDETAQKLLAELRACKSTTDNSRLRYLRDARCWSGQLALFPKRIRDAIKLEES